MLPLLDSTQHLTAAIRPSSKANMSTWQKQQFSLGESEPGSAHLSTDDVSLQSLPKQRLSSAAYGESGEFLVSPQPSDLQPIGRPRRPARSKLGQHSQGFRIVVFISDLILTLCPCLFLILAFKALAVANEPITSIQGRTVEQAAKLSPTLFPIMFAAVCGRFMRTYALWRAEKGSALGILEQLNGSQNLIAALERAILIPDLGLLSVGIVLVWLLSPLGGQSSLRVLGRGHSTHANETTVYYFNTTAQGGGPAFGGSSAYSDLQNGLNAVFQATMTSLENTKGRDIWGNIKIPVMQYMTSQVGSDGWLDFDENTYNAPYSALNGLIISGLRDDTSSNFSVESSYFNLSCTGPKFFNMSVGPAEDFGGFVQYASPFVTRNNNASSLFVSDSSSTFAWNSYVVDTNYNHTPHSDANPVYNIIYASQYGGQEDQTDIIIAAYNCSVGITYIENDLLCNGKSCQVRRLRPSRKFGPNLSGYPWPSLSISPVYWLLSWMGTATSMTGSGDASPIDHYISGSNTPFDITQTISYANVTGEQVEKRLQSLVNTGWQLAYQGSATAQAPSENLTALARSEDSATPNWDSGSGGVGYPVGNAVATMTLTTDVFVVHRVWVAVTAIVSIVLLLCGIAGMAFKYVSHSPDILGFVSSMTRDNPNFEHIPGSDRMNGLERARAMRNVQVQIVDVAPWGEGHITLRNVGGSVGDAKLVP